MNKKLLIALVLVVAAGAGAVAFRMLSPGRTGPGQRRPQGQQAARVQLPPRDLDELCAWLMSDYRGYGAFGTVNLEERLAELAKHEAAGKPAAIVAAHESVAEMCLRLGESERGVEHLDAAYALAQEAGLTPAKINGLRKALGVAHMRLGEISHCIAMHNPESCLFPLSGDGVWSDTSGAIRAIGYYEDYLAQSPDDPAVRWLLNVAHMAAGTWPDGIDERLRVPVASMDPGANVQHFEDVAGDIGLDTFSGAGGIILDDFDGDGLLDAITSSIFPCGQLRYYHNSGDGTFEDWTERSGLIGQLGGLNCVQADYDGDGRLDVLLLRGAWMGKMYGRQRNSLLRNDESGRFIDVTAEAGLDSAFPTQTADWADYDGDGDLDLYIGNEMVFNELYRNEGDGTFTEVADEAGVRSKMNFTKGVDWGDFDNDGDPDLYVSNWTRNNLFRNEGDGTFTDIAPQMGVDGPEPNPEAIGNKKLNGPPRGDETFACWFWDYDNDGWLDIFSAPYSSPLANVAADYYGEPLEDSRRLKIYHSESGTGFRDMASEMGIADVLAPMGSNYGDVNNDGFPDFYLGTGQPEFEYLVPNALYVSIGGMDFTDATTEADVGHLQKGHGIAFGDLDNDGDQDIFAQMGGFYPADGYRDAVFENPGNGNHWVTLVPRGRVNRFAVGARIRVVVATPAGERSIHAVVGSGGSFGASSLQAEVGLGDAESIERVEVQWPSGGALQTYTGIPIDSAVLLTEGEPDAKVIERPRLQFPD